MARAAWIVLFAIFLTAAPEALAQGGDMTGLAGRIAVSSRDEAVRLGDALYAGNGIPQDSALALAAYERAAAQGDIRAHLMASFLLRGKLDPAAFHKAQMLVQRAIGLCASGATDPLCQHPAPWRELSYVQAGLFQFGDALEASREALAVAQRASPADPVTVALIRQDMGSIMTRIGQLPDAVAMLEAALSALEQNLPSDDQQIAFALSDLGMAYQHSGRGADAVTVERRAAGILTKALGENHGTVGGLHNNIGWALKDSGRLDEAYVEFETAARILSTFYGSQSAEIAYPTSNMGIIRERQGRHDEAIPLNMKALVVETRFRAAMLEPLRWTLQSLSRSWKAKGDMRAAILFAKLAVNAHQEIRQRSTGLDQTQAAALAADWRGIYDELAEMQVSQGRVSEAQYVLDLQKQQELITFVRGDTDTAGPAGLTPRETKDAQQLDAAMARPLALAAELDSLTQQGSALSPEDAARKDALTRALDESYSAFVTDVDALLAASSSETAKAQADVANLNLDYAADRQEMLRGFTTPTVLLQAASLGNKLHLFLTTKDISLHREVPVTRADLSRMVLRTLEAINRRSPEADRQLSQLYDLLIRPVEQDLKDSGADVVMLNLGGFLRYVPFAALKSDHGYLIESYALALDTPAAQTRFETRDRSHETAAGFGVTAAQAGFSPLPGVAAELEAIFKGADSQGELDGNPSLDASFTAESLKAALGTRPSLLHVASHFKFVPGDETRSFLLLGDGKQLTLEQIRKGRGLRFGGVDLLTLSACETAKGVDGEGDEVESFGALAQMNGASAVMATLWPIADATSGRLMADFYQGLIEAKLDKAQALRRAQIAMLRGIPAPTVDLTARGAAGLDEPVDQQQPITSRHPYYWSPYILMGNWL